MVKIRPGSALLRRSRAVEGDPGEKVVVGDEPTAGAATLPADGDAGEPSLGDLPEEDGAADCGQVGRLLNAVHEALGCGLLGHGWVSLLT